MSNYSRVIICWSSIDERADTREEIDRRATEIVKSLGRGRLIATIHGCSVGHTTDSACETVLVLSSNAHSPLRSCRGCR